jgi:Amt family ammonium transporter
MLRDLDGKLWDGSNLPGLSFACFQMTFAVIAAAIISGSVVERMAFFPYAVMIALWSLLVYSPLAHWVWGGGWIQKLGALDFAGGTVVHISSGVSGYTAAALLGPRKHKEEDASGNVPFVILGASLLWFGWIGFNGGSALGASDGVAARAVMATNLAAASAMMTWMCIQKLRTGRVSAVGAMVGAVAGLVNITPACGYVTPASSLAIGVLGACFCYAAVAATNRFDKVDDTLDAFGLHGAGGISGAVLTGLFAIDDGLFFGGGGTLLWKNIVGALAGVAYSAAVTAIIVLAMKCVCNVRVSEDIEGLGVDEHTHGENYNQPKTLSPSKTFQSDGQSESTAAESGV